ncbi:ABC transporter-related protein [Chloroherpeton thalassium ATCC 35110]|uniref:ABC transporter-related protein n=1 Tax=Chloroherpeton thalassium (strain ATCC 35110 / GB-78) TaxID=517418 RepID=B3QXF1_CHLT3|nr:ATP-binding cassette domain-containing protein [Chloroherpeton thalassium]ACF13425.1 ABC transporter-related protein [Chloroherpeton thalassium ATCC 35110]
MNSLEEILEKEIKSVKTELPQLIGFFGNYGIELEREHLALGDYLSSFTEEHYEDLGIDKQQLIENLDGFLEQLAAISNGGSMKIASLTIIGGHDKTGSPENIELTLVPGSITSIVGPTGSGKSRLLADIEWMAQNDTPTGRTILVNGEKPDTNLRFSLEHKLVAQLSQNMNFVMDTCVSEFIRMHAESRMVKNIPQAVSEIVAQANMLAGEKFTEQTPVTALSGGQSRALMIADTAFLSSSPVVLIDEIENAGIDRKKALALLVKKEKIVLMATHDPILALMAEQRLVIKNGGIYKIIQTSLAEKSNLSALEALDNKILSLRTSLRRGDLIEQEIA